MNMDIKDTVRISEVDKTNFRFGVRTIAPDDTANQYAHCTWRHVEKVVFIKKSRIFFLPTDKSI